MLIPSKLYFPKRLHNTIRRARVLKLLTHSEHYKLVLFRSPAGYGKTTMAAQWLTEKELTGWYNIDEDDNDEYRFAHYFIHAIIQATQLTLPRSKASVENRQFASLTSLFSQLFIELSAFNQHAFIVLDDYHLIHNDRIHSGLKFFLQHLPDNVTLVITSRSLPPLNTANLRIRDRLIEIDSHHLAFDQTETSQFFTQRLKQEVDQVMVQHIQTHVEGWVSALQLIALNSLQNQQSITQSSSIISHLNPTHLWDYLAEEVFTQLDKTTQHFLMRSAIFKYFNASLLNEALQRTDSQLMIENLHRFGLFIQSNDEQNGWYQYHHLFAEFLTHQRQKYLVQEETALQQKATAAWLNQKEIYQALYHAKKAQSEQLITDILLQHGWTLFDNGELPLLESTITQLNKTRLLVSPQLSIIQAWLKQSQHNYLQVDDLLSEAQHEMNAKNITLDQHTQAEFDTLRAQVAINKNQPKLALNFAEKALEELKTSQYRSRIIATSVIGEYHHVSGNLAQALVLMQQTEKMAMIHGFYHQALWAILQQSEILMAQSFVQSAFELQEQGFKLVNEYALEHVPMYEFLLRARAQIYWLWARFNEAEQYTIKGLDVLSPFDETKHLHSYAMLAGLAVVRGELDKADRYLDNCQQLLRQTDYHIDWKATLSSVQLYYWHIQDDHKSITNWLSQAEKPATRCNHFTQRQWRNIAKAHYYLGDIEHAITIIGTSKQIAEKHQLITEINQNLVIESILLYKKNQPESATKAIHKAINLSNQTGIISSFLMVGKEIIKPLNKLQQQENLTKLEKHKIEQIQNNLSKTQRCNAAHFDETFIEKLLTTPNLPELIRTSPLTQREWQVLGLIYSGFSNEQIAMEFDVAPTTIKTHIRNLYQKLNLPNRKAAIEMADKLVNMTK